MVGRSRWSRIRHIDGQRGRVFSAIGIAQDIVEYFLQRLGRRVVRTGRRRIGVVTVVLDSEHTAKGCGNDQNATGVLPPPSESQ